MINTIQLLRFVAAFVVLFYHVFAVSLNKLDIVYPIYFKTGTIGVDIFFIISGFVIGLCTPERKNTKSLYRFLLRRVFRIYPIYWFYTIIILFLYLIFPGKVNSSYSMEPSLLHSLILLPYIEKPYLNVGWTLIFEVYFYLIMAFLSFIFCKENIKKILFVYLTLILLINFNLPVDNYFYTNYFFNAHVLEFIVGYFLCVYRKKIIFAPALSSILLLLSISFAIFGTEYFPYETSFDRVLLYVVPSALIFNCFYSLDKFIAVPKIFVLFGDSSYSFYLSHVLVINALLILLVPVTGEVWFLFFSILFSLLFSVVSYKILECRIISFGKVVEKLVLK